QYWDWRPALVVAGVPGLLLGLLALAIPEPARGAAEQHDVGAARRPGSPLLTVLRIPTMWFIILAGIVHTYCMYALGNFLSSLLIRSHGLTVEKAGWVAGVVYGFGGGIGLLGGGWICDRLVRRRVSARLEVATLAVLIAAPCTLLALQAP